MVTFSPSDNGPNETEPAEDGGRPRYRPPIGIPLAKQRRGGSMVLAVLLHVLAILLLIVDLSRPDSILETLGAGGPGPAGGGGGGNRGTGGAKERIEFVNVAPPAPRPQPPPVVRPANIPPITPPPPPPKPVEEPKQTPPVPTTDNATATDAAQASSVVAGTGGGTGNDGSAGNGPGSGGGVGTGVGTGRGSGVGPGTGGGTGTIYPPTPTELFLAPPPPNRLRGTEIVVIFDIDSTGKVLDLSFEPTKDNSYNRKLREKLKDLKFRPASGLTGNPIRMKYEMTFGI